jgi:uncharacterized membrane protein YjfL (UPF0719 family)
MHWVGAAVKLSGVTQPKFMSGDEKFILILCGIWLLFFWSEWFLNCFSVVPMRSRLRDRSFLLVAPLLCAVLLLFILRQYASHDVRDDFLYLLFYTAMGAAWVGFAAKFVFPWLDLNARDDVIERNNVAAAMAIGGALVGVTLAFAGGNIGDGPGWWAVVCSAALSTGTLLAGWIFLNSCTHVSDAITIDRDVPSGLRVCGFFIASGLIVGRSVAGDWVSVSATVSDYLQTVWPVFLFWICAIGVELILRPKPASLMQSSAASGIPALAVYILVGALFALMWGKW